MMDTVALEAAARNLLVTLNAFMYENDQCCLEVAKHNAPEVEAAIDKLRRALA